MAQVYKGVRSILGLPYAYDSFQNIVGARRLRKVVVERYLKAGRRHRLLDVGCGTGNWLSSIPEGVAYVGVDVNTTYIDSAKRNWGTRGKFICQSAVTLCAEQNGKFDVVLAFGLLHHLDDEEVVQLMRAITDVLEPDGWLVTGDGCIEDSQSGIARAIMLLDRGRNIRTADGYKKLASQVFRKVTTSVERSLLRIPYSHVFMKCER